MVLFWVAFAGLGAFLSASDTGTRSGGPGGTAAGRGSKDGKRPEPEPATYRGVNLPDGHFLALGDRPLRPRDLDEGGVVSELTYLSGFVGGGRLGIDEPNGKMALLERSQKGTLATCRAETRFVDDVQVKRLAPGARLCVRTSTGHVALVTYRGHSPESAPSDYVKLDVTVWRNAIEAEDG
ncbi:hypothetical protein FM076_26755 [Streptomyces albus subsp. chlorinus]|nr:hypothetical protein [Streptomyces albus subsp. chlorinus]